MDAHRMAYIKGKANRRIHSGRSLPFCRAESIAADTDDGLVIAGGTYTQVVLNKFPYNSGHLLICPYRPSPNTPN